MTWLAESLLAVLAESPVARAVADLAAQLDRDRHAVDKALCVLHRRGLVERLAFRSVAEFRNDYPAFFWRVLAPFIRDGIRLLEYTDDGRMWLAQMHAHVLAEEHRGGH